MSRAEIDAMLYAEAVRRFEAASKWERPRRKQKGRTRLKVRPDGIGLSYSGP